METRSRKALILLLMAVFYTPFIFTGYGADDDAHRIIKTTKALFDDHAYSPTRYPGYIVFEMPSSVLLSVGGSVLSNLGALTMSILAVYSFLGICEHYRIPHASFLAVLMLVNPIYWASSTSTMDYVWALGLMLAGYLALLRSRYSASGILLGLSVGARLTSIIFVAVLVLSELLKGSSDRKKFFKSVLLSAIVAAALYVPSFIHAGHSLKFLTVQVFDWNLASKYAAYGISGYAARFIYKNIYFWGLQTVLGAALLSPLFWGGFRDAFNSGGRKLALFCVLVVVGYEFMFLAFPHELAYLLPAMPFELMLLGMALEDKRTFILLLILLTLSYNIVSVNFVTAEFKNPEKKLGTMSFYGVMLQHNFLASMPNIGDIQSFGIGIAPEWGYLVTDTVVRMNLAVGNQN